jgi:glycine/D-amino acid oxidase-like deaminating enzyme/nitrite reductase/ring-hydroxylating ferredoxin subunit
MARGSLWIESSPGTAYRSLRGDAAVDVAVIGAGITGATAALLLKRAGKTVALLDMKGVGRGATGYTTAKVTSGHGAIYGPLRRRFGEEGARLYAAANEAAIGEIRAIAERERIDCELEEQANFVYTERREAVAELKEEVEAARAAGLAASLVGDPGLPYPVAAAVRLDGPAQFHPRKYVLGLVAAVDGDGSHVFERSRATDVRSRRAPVVETAEGRVRARDVVVATHLPFEDKAMLFARAYPARSYAIAAAVAAADAPGGMHISIDEPTRSVRTAPGDDGRRLLLVGGEGHKTGQQPDTEGCYARLEAWMAERFGAGPAEYRWSTQDYISVDRAPFAGRLAPGVAHVWGATAYGKWGMTNGTAAAQVVVDGILGRPNPWAALFSSRRVRSLLSRRFASVNAAASGHLVGDRLRVAGRDAADRLAPGEGIVVRSGRRALAVSRGDDGELVAVSARCTHLGCLVTWNPAERSWDCPCHGSRFLADGTLIQGPAVADLERRALG